MSRPDARPFATPRLQAIGFVRSSLRLHHEAPRQSGLGRGASAIIEICQGMQNGLQDLDGFSHIWLLFWCHHARCGPTQVRPPRDERRRGVFATRAPQRPNPIGLSAVGLAGMDKRMLRITDCDLLDATPILDVKPYLPYCDSLPDACTGYVRDLDEGRADHRVWWEERGLAPPKRYQERLP